MPTLKWLGDSEARVAARKVPYRILDPIETVGDPKAENLLIQGDNLEALKALLPFYAGRVKCIFIDPPYNTRTDFGHYDDNLEHSQWLSTLYPRVDLLRSLLTDDGSLWITIDDNEAHYLKVISDEIFGRNCFIADIAWKRRDGAPNDRKIGSTYDHVLVYAKSPGRSAKKTLAEESFNLMQRTEKADSQYKLYEEPFGFDERGPFRKVDSTGNAKGGRYVESLIYPVTNPFTGEEVYPRKGRCWVYKKEVMLAMVADRRFFWGKDGTAGTPMRKLFKSEAKSGMTAPTIWDDAGLNQHAAREIELLFGEKAAFETPKPENLMKRIIEIASSTNDIVLDSFLGSGTTAAVAHKMGRRWIGIEMGDHAHTHCLPRLKKVVDGEQGGISASVGWQGGGGFRFMKLGAKAFFDDGALNADIRFKDLAAYLWFLETRTPHPTGQFKSPLLGLHDGIAYVLLYNGIIADRRPESGNVLTTAVWNDIRPLLPRERREAVIYGEASRFSDARLKDLRITFKQIPYDVGMR